MEKNAPSRILKAAAAEKPEKKITAPNSSNPVVMSIATFQKSFQMDF